MKTSVARHFGNTTTGSRNSHVVSAYIQCLAIFALILLYIYVSLCRVTVAETTASIISQFASAMSSSELINAGSTLLAGDDNPPLNQVDPPSPDTAPYLRLPVRPSDQDARLPVWYRGL